MFTSLFILFGVIVALAVLAPDLLASILVVCKEIVYLPARPFQAIMEHRERMKRLELMINERRKEL